MPESTPPKKARLKLDKSDGLYLSGALLIVGGIALHSMGHALVAAGCFCLVFPICELASSFVKGVRK